MQGSGLAGDWQTWMRGEGCVYGHQQSQVPRLGLCRGGCLTSITPMTVAIPCINEKNEELIFEPSYSPAAKKRWVILTSSVHKLRFLQKHSR